jgi:hypothetical protein
MVPAFLGFIQLTLLLPSPRKIADGAQVPGRILASSLCDTVANPVVGIDNLFPWAHKIQDRGLNRAASWMDIGWTITKLL